MRTYVRSVVAGLVLTVATGGATSASAGIELEKQTWLEWPRVCEGQPLEIASWRGEFAPLLSAPDLHSGRFGLELLGALTEEGSDNALVSPLGIGTVLAMVSQGAKESVRRSIGEVIQGGGDALQGGDGDAAPTGSSSSSDSGAGGQADNATASDDDAIPDTNSTMMLACQLFALRIAQSVDEGVVVNFANGVFANRNLELFPSYSAAIDSWFDARIERLDFADESAVTRINAWVSEATREAIPHLIDTLEPGDALVLANAVHFRGDWMDPFDPERTVPAPFHLRSGATAEVLTMHAEELSARYREDDDFQAIALPYGLGGFELVAVVPQREVDAPEAIRQLTSDPTWLGGHGFQRARGSLALPRLALEADVSLLPVLRSLGLESALNDKQAFAGIADPAPILSQVQHRTMLLLDEQGTMAAAATVAVMTSRSALDPTTFDMRVDRPFALAVRYRPTGAVLFVAWVESPPQGAAIR